MAYKHDWFEYNIAVSPAIKREKHIDLRTGINWDLIEKLNLDGMIYTGCVLLDKAGLIPGYSSRPLHIKELVEVRNALLHNNGNIKKNRNTDALQLIKDYIANDSHLELNDPNADNLYISQAPFKLNGDIVEANKNALHLITLLIN